MFSDGLFEFERPFIKHFQSICKAQIVIHRRIVVINNQLPRQDKASITNFHSSARKALYSLAEDLIHLFLFLQLKDGRPLCLV